jgi:hypothetical protein
MPFLKTAAVCSFSLRVASAVGKSVIDLMVARHETPSPPTQKHHIPLIVGQNLIVHRHTK